ncbi:MAG: response regulator transcription factor [Sphingobacteriales bacterium]|nr:response regulator transcription factor [Sphingobacteriales bacterium]MBI3720582.1 response regulator transcription factor [Sphingobacteriales bacterium]
MNSAGKIVLVDDHVLLRRGLAGLVKDLGYEVLFEADNGKDFIEKIIQSGIPDVVLLDITMPVMDGYETATWLKVNHPEVKVLALSMNDNETAVIKMIRLGAKGYILKDSDPAELALALQSVITKGFYYSEMITGKLIHAVNSFDKPNNAVISFLLLNEREIEFLKLVCTELTYKEIADKMYVSPRTVDGYRDILFEKLDVKTRVGLVMYAVRQGIVHP